MPHIWACLHIFLQDPLDHFSSSVSKCRLSYFTFIFRFASAPPSTNAVFAFGPSPCSTWRQGEFAVHTIGSRDRRHNSTCTRRLFSGPICYSIRSISRPLYVSVTWVYTRFNHCQPSALQALTMFDSWTQIEFNPDVEVSFEKILDQRREGARLLIDMAFRSLEREENSPRRLGQREKTRFM